MLEINRESLSFIYNKVVDSESFALSLIIDVDVLKTFYFDIHTAGGLYRTIIRYTSDNGIEVPSSTDLDTHLDDLQDTLESIVFCKNCDLMCTSDQIYDGENCMNCTFIKLFKQDHLEHKCSICLEKIEYDWLKASCCKSFFHKTCRYKYGKWKSCPNCRSDDISY